MSRVSQLQIVHPKSGMCQARNTIAQYRISSGKELVGIIAILSSALFIPGAVHAIMGILVLTSLFSLRGAVYSLFLMGLIREGNFTYVPVDKYLLMLMWLVFLSASVKIILNTSKRHWHTSLLLRLLLFGDGIFLISVLASPYRAISISKLVSFLMGSTALLMGFCHLRGDRKFIDWGGTDHLLSLTFVSLTFLSLPTLFFRGFGYARDGLGFQGITCHPQAFGIILAPLISWAIGVWIQGIEKRESKNFLTTTFGLALIGVAFLLLLESRCRTALLSIALSIVCCTIATFVGKKNWRSYLQTFLFRSYWPILLVLVLGFVAIFAQTEVISFFKAFIIKGDKPSTLTQAFDESRGRIMRSSWTGFCENPLLGAGFGISSSMDDLQIVRDPLFNLPISAPIEKGNAFTQILGETGVVGTLLFASLLLRMLRQVMLSTTFPYAMLFFSALFTNLGEASLFSMGGEGIIMWSYMVISLSEERTA